MSQSVAKWTEFARAYPTSISYWYLLDAMPGSVSKHEHFRRELHTVGGQWQLQQAVPPKGAESRLTIVEPSAGRHCQEQIERWGSEAAMEPRHCAIFKTPFDARTNDKVRAIHNSLNKTAKLSQVVTSIGIGDDDDLTSGLF